ncbi:molybdopterin-dependent oxidoreductase [Croceicoccus sp. BE223]|uniref:molybdopterin-dependent oxidoreductase n=1 Tax=Croceicoccus sp. BE223 TaxID=2817716 RepID=UPI0028602230|nr:molybdopterin-dependent oxidoreductase [Croceicoccus sp. BE223]MDR7101227.1 assimilatory nitrate reductase catalytic subunit [Croceicoccus sp. BE223]
MRAPVATTCAYCGVGCGIVATPGAGDREVAIAGDTNHPANRGRLCIKGTTLGDTVGLEGRLLYPMIGNRRASWDEAARFVARTFADTIAEHGPDSVAFYVSGQLLTEDYYAANKLMKGFIGSGNIDTNSRLCMASAVAAHNRAFGEDHVPVGYEDLEAADLIVLVGSNTAWCHPVVWQRIEAARAARGTKVVVVDPRRTETASEADLHVRIAPDGDIPLFRALLAEMRGRGLVDGAFLDDRCVVPDGFWTNLDGAHGEDLPDAFAALADLVAAHPRMVTVFSMGSNQSVRGTDKGNAIINLHLALGRIGQAGMGPFSLTGQPNAMGGREVGGLASTLACHLGFADDEREAVAGFWGTDRLCSGPGLKAVDMFRAVDDGRIRAIWVMATNPAVSMPDAGFVRKALEKCPFVVVSDCMADTDTARLAHVRLPAKGWGEKNGTVTNSERMVSRQRPFLAPAGEAKADWRIVAEVAAAMGHGAAFGWTGPAAVFRENATMTGLAARRGLKLDFTAMADLSDEGYDALEPFRWGTGNLRADGFSFADRRARLVDVAPLAATPFDPAFPLRLNTGRYRDQWHTMTRTGLSARLATHRPEPLAEVHPIDAAVAGISDGGLARIATPRGATVLRVRVTDAQAKGTIFAPMHWSDLFASGGRTNRLTSPAHDPVSGQPGFKDCAAAIAPVVPEWRAFLASTGEPVGPDVLYWAKARQAKGWLVELAGVGDVPLDAVLPEGRRLEAEDTRRGMQRIAVIGEDGRLAAAMFVTRSGDLPPRDWIAAQLGDDAAGPVELLAARPATPRPDPGPQVCVCFDVGLNTILAAIAQQRLTSVEAIGRALNAGTNCGSCRPQLSAILRETNLAEAAE